MSLKICQQVTEQIRSALHQGQVPWGRAWLGHKNDGSPTNALTSLPFRGINVLLLNLAGCKSRWWASERCWTAFGFNLKPGQQGVRVFHGKLDDLQSQTVFNAEQVAGPGVERYLVGGTPGQRLPAFEAADRVIAATGADIRHVPGNEAAYYRLPKDYIVLPLQSQFVSEAAYQTTVLHELCHFSEHRIRWFADAHLTIKERYRGGELRATICSALLCAQIGIPFFHNETSHRMCLSTWIQLMKADPSLIFRVTDAAEQAAEYILSFSRQQLAMA
jgi:antirestriction protein ArdC